MTAKIAVPFRFVELVKTGKKRQAIQNETDAMPDMAVILTTPDGHVIRGSKCVSAKVISIGKRDISVGGKMLTSHSKATLARSEGFQNIGELRRFIRDNYMIEYGWPFVGYLVKWD